MQQIFIDESGTGSRYMVIGSIWVHEEALGELRGRLVSILDTHFVNRRELKWKKVSRSKLAGYLQVLDAFFSTLGVRFRCIVLDTSKIDHHRYSNGDAELGYYKFVYQLVSKNICKDRKLFGSAEQYIITHDVVSHRIKQGTRLEDLKDILNVSPEIMQATGSRVAVRDIQAQDSKNSIEIQITDILSGAVRHAFEMQGEYRNSSRTKRAVIDHIAARAGLRTLALPTSYGAEKVNIWEFRLS